MIPPDDEGPLAGERWVEIWCEYGAAGVWNKRGRACSLDDLPVPDHILDMIRGWQEWFEYSDMRLETIWFDGQAHAAFGFFIARLVKQHLPDWTVIYSRAEITAEMIALRRPTHRSQGD